MESIKQAINDILNQNSAEYKALMVCAKCDTVDTFSLTVKAAIGESVLAHNFVFASKLADAYRAVVIVAAFIP